MKSKKFETWVQELKSGTLICTTWGNYGWNPCVFKKWTSDQAGAQFVDIPNDDSSGYNYYKQDQWEELKKGSNIKPWISFINTNATNRVIPYSEDFLTKNQKEFYKLIKLMLS